MMVVPRARGRRGWAGRRRHAEEWNGGKEEAEVIRQPTSISCVFEIAIRRIPSVQERITHQSDEDRL